MVCREIIFKCIPFALKLSMQSPLCARLIYQAQGKVEVTLGGLIAPPIEVDLGVIPLRGDDNRIDAGQV
jgi:hypothetical protein